MKNKLNNALNNINEKYIEEAANADRLEKPSASAIKYIAGGTAAAAAVAAICIGLNHFGVFNRGVDLVDSVPSASGSTTSDSALSDGYQYELEYYWEDSMPLVSITQDYVDNLIFGSEFPYMLYANEEKAVFTDGLAGIYVYSFTEEKLTLAADINKNVEFIRDNAPFEFFNIDPNNSSPAPIVNFQCGIGGEIICTVTYYNKIPSTLGRTEYEYRANMQYYRINEEDMTLELFDTYLLTDYALYNGLRSVTETKIEGALSHNVAMIEGKDRCVYLTLTDTFEDMLYNIKIWKHNSPDEIMTCPTGELEGYMVFDGYLAKNILQGTTYRSMMSTTTSDSNYPELTFNNDGTFSLTHVFGDNTAVHGTYITAGDVVRLYATPISSPMQPVGSDITAPKGTAWYLRFDESNALWAYEDSFVSADGYALAGDKAVFIKQNHTVRYGNLEQTVKVGDEYYSISAMLALDENGNYAMTLDDSGDDIEFSGTYSETDTAITLNDISGDVYIFTKDGNTLLPDDAFIDWVDNNPDHPACAAFLKSPVLYNFDAVGNITNGTVSYSSQPMQAQINGETISYRLRIELIYDGTALLYVDPDGAYCPLTASVLVDEGTHKIENGRFSLSFIGQDSTLTLDADHDDLYGNIMNNISANFDPNMNTPYSDEVYDKLAEKIADNTPLELPQTGNSMAAFCDRVLMANEPSAILESYTSYQVSYADPNSSIVGDMLVDKNTADKAGNLFFNEDESLMGVTSRSEYTGNGTTIKECYVVTSTIGDFSTDGSKMKEYLIDPETLLIQRIYVYDCTNGTFEESNDCIISYSAHYDAADEYESIIQENIDMLNTDRQLMDEFVAKIAENHDGEIIPANTWLFPVDSTNITTYFGYDSWRGDTHDGIDIAAEGNSAICAAADGTAYVGNDDNSWFGGYGNTVAVLHDGGYITVYSCARDILVENGERVTAGQRIATVGTTGASTGNHLHFELRAGTEPINPFNVPYHDINLNIDTILSYGLADFSGDATLPQKLALPLPDDCINLSEGFGDNGGYTNHSGIDFNVPLNTAVYAAADGEVIYADWLGSYGNCIIIKHENGCFTLYAHLNSIEIPARTHCSAGEMIGYSGSTGMTTGACLHFELRRGLTPVDPTSLLNL